MQYFIIKKEKNSLNNQKKIKNEININPKNEYSLNSNNDTDTYKFYKTYNTFNNIKNKIENKLDINRDNSKEKFKSFYDSGTLKSYSKSNFRKIKNLKHLCIITNKKKKQNMIFNNNLISNHFSSFNKELKSFKSRLNEINKTINSRYRKEQKDILSSFDEDNENERELKQFSLTIDKKIKANNYSIRVFKKGHIISKYYNNENKKLENIKNDLETSNSNKYKRIPKFSTYYF